MGDSDDNHKDHAHPKSGDGGHPHNHSGHEHDHEHGEHPHEHTHAAPDTQTRLWLAVGLTLVFVLGEAAAGLYSDSLALLSDAGHNFADALALILSLGAVWIGKRPARSRHTYGFHRVGILIALVNATSLVVIALGIFWEAAQRLRHPAEVNGPLMMGVAAVALLLNGAISLSLHHGAKDDLNLKSVYLHMLGDAIASCGVIVAGLVIWLSGWQQADAVVSLAIGLLILWSSWSVLKESVAILLDAAPASLDMKQLEEAIRGTPGVLGVHHLHVWTVASGMISCSCHVLVAEQTVAQGEQVLRAVAARLSTGFKVNHSTIQIEVEGCEADDMYCTTRPLVGKHHHGHSH